MAKGKKRTMTDYHRGPCKTKISPASPCQNPVACTMATATTSERGKSDKWVHSSKIV